MHAERPDLNVNCISYDYRVQKILCDYKIDRLCRCNVTGYRILRDEKFCTYNPPDNGPAKIVISINIIENYHKKEFDWVVLHECGHLYYRHPWHTHGLTSKENELCADYWACKQQKRSKYGIDALLRLCNRDISKISHTKIVRDVSRRDRFREGKFFKKFTFGDRITALENSDLTY